MSLQFLIVLQGCLVMVDVALRGHSYILLIFMFPLAKLDSRFPFYSPLSYPHPSEEAYFHPQVAPQHCATGTAEGGELRSHEGHSLNLTASIHRFVMCTLRSESSPKEETGR